MTRPATRARAVRTLARPAIGEGAPRLTLVHSSARRSSLAVHLRAFCGCRQKNPSLGALRTNGDESSVPTSLVKPADEGRWADVRPHEGAARSSWRRRFRSDERVAALGAVAPPPGR